MNPGPDFEAYLRSKNIDSQAFRDAEPKVWSAWKLEFEQVHPNSFTVQKLNLINPIRRKYMLKVVPEAKVPAATKTDSETPKPAKPAVARPAKPVIRPKPN